MWEAFGREKELLNRKNELLKGMSWREIADGGK
jgi:hypothetical protein